LTGTNPQLSLQLFVTSAHSSFVVQRCIVEATITSEAKAGKANAAEIKAKTLKVNFFITISLVDNAMEYKGLNK
jgi:hypothetical protein